MANKQTSRGWFAFVVAVLISDCYMEYHPLLLRVRFLSFQTTGIGTALYFHRTRRWLL